MESHQPKTPTETLSYATPALPTGKRTWGAVAVLLGGLAMIGLGGCFLIGVLWIDVATKIGPNGDDPAHAATPSSIILSIVLYLLAGGCFVGAVTLIIISLRWLKAIIFG